MVKMNVFINLVDYIDNLHIFPIENIDVMKHCTLNNQHIIDYFNHDIRSI